VVADDTLVGMPAAGVTEGVNENTLLLINSHESARTWARRLNTRARILILTAKDEVEDRAELPYIGSRCAAAAAVLCGVISRDLLLAALNEELAHLPDEVVKKNRDTAVDVFENMAGEVGLVSQGGQQIMSGRHGSRCPSKARRFQISPFTPALPASWFEPAFGAPCGLLSITTNATAAGGYAAPIAPTARST
jgi:hypothetical protein